MPSYKVFLKDKSEFIVAADDVDLTSCGDQGCRVHFFNFLKGADDNAITVAAVPFEDVQKIVS